MMEEEAVSSLGEVIYVAVGTNLVKEKPNLLWVMRNFLGAEVVLIHVHVLSKGIPMMGTKILPSIASEYAIRKYRKEERERMTELMMKYINFCQQRKVQVKAAVIQNNDVSLGLQRLVQKHQIKRLVHGSSGATLIPRNPEEEEQYWSTLSNRWDSEDYLPFVSPPNDREDEVVNDVEETRPGTPARCSRCSTKDAINAESLKQQLAAREEELAELRRKNMQAKEDARCSIEKIATLEQQLEALRQENFEAIRENSALKTHLRCTEFSASELGKATNDFHPSQKIAEGGYGPVYRGILRHTPVAIKVLNPQSKQGPREFQQEMLVLSKIRHPNVVILHGVCSETSALVYEYLPNGNLDERLSGKKAPHLSCWDRFRIISEQRSVLLFLHSSQPYAIVHADLKPQNILLDANNISKLGDFGTARKILLSGAEDESICLGTNPMGTMGYMDPVFLTDGLLTPQSDIYSFGILILKLLSGFPVLRIRERVEEGLRRGSVSQLLDDSAGQWPVVQAEKLMQLALKCCSFEMSCRPSLLSEEWKILETSMAMTEHNEIRGGDENF
ncbi:U-box domain-containing protein 33 isoform X2 [Dendrobium catenatum]|uniref:U-box domain-containing protein 33 isoform X2 n=1 Tax=Dendrobium catenatum TaxID=906689 RepID=UPI0010A06EB2|nr:U-box domain-containing protein 33 isoform X2 [Dendrobium catenatum]